MVFLPDPLTGQPLIPGLRHLDPIDETHEAGEIEKPVDQTPLAPQQTIHNEARARSLQSELKLSGSLQAMQLQSQLDVMTVGSRGPQVKELQSQLNVWRAQQGKPPIGADGVYGKETEAAVKDFQVSVGLKQDGLAGPDVKRYMGAAMTLSQDPNYQQLSNESKNLAVFNLAKKPNDLMHQDNVRGMVKDLNTLEHDRGYQQLPPNTQQGIRNLMYTYTDRPVGRQMVNELATSYRFQNLTPAQQEKMLGTVMANANQETGQYYPHYMKWILDSKALDGPKDEQLTNAVVNTMDRVAADSGKLFSLHEMLNDPVFVNSPREDQLAQLNALAGRSGLEVA